MAQKLRLASVAFSCFRYPPLLERSGPHMPVTPDCESQPQAVDESASERPLLVLHTVGYSPLLHHPAR